MSNAFDLEKAKTGKPVEHRVNLSGNWEQVHFVGEAIDGTPVIQVGRNVFACDEAYLRMAPKKVKVRYRVALFSDNGETWPGVTTSEAIAESWPSKKTFQCWLHAWKEAEVEL
jgi:hypothetical protein